MMGGQGSGQHPTPTAILALRGSSKANRKVGEPPAPEGRPGKPDWVQGEAAKIWRRLVRNLAAMNLATPVDWAAVGRYCVNLARWIEVQTLLNVQAKNLPTYATPYKDERGQIVKWVPLPGVNHAQKLESSLVQFERQFGLTPSARRALAVDKESDPNENRGKYDRTQSVRAKLFG
jgi:P27 family predicted phage terminase small subunit